MQTQTLMRQDKPLYHVILSKRSIIFWQLKWQNIRVHELILAFDISGT